MAKKSAKNTHPGIDGSDDLAFRLGFYIHDTSRLRKLLFDAQFKPAGVTRAQASVLSCLWSQDEITQSELAKKLDLGKVALGSLIDRLEAAGMVERRGDVADRRAKLIVVTAAGRTALAQLRELAGATNDIVLAGLSARDIEVTARTLKRMKANVIGALGVEAAGVPTESTAATKRPGS